MSVVDYFNSLPMDTRYYLLDYAKIPGKIRDAIGDKADDPDFFAALTKYLQATQNKRIRDARREHEIEFKREFTGKRLAEKVISPYTGEVLYEAGTKLTPEVLQKLLDNDISWLNAVEEEDAYSNENPTGVANPADYMNMITFEKDTDNDGDIDTKITKRFTPNIDWEDEYEDD